VFSLFLPITEVQSTTPPASEVDSPRTGNSRILLIDDEEIVRQTAKAALEGAGYTVLLALDGVSGLDVFYRHREELDLVLLDLGMPGKTGTEVLREIREVDSMIPVVIASGYSEEEVAKRFEGAAISGTIAKPFTGPRLVAAVARVLANARGEKVTCD